MRPVSRSDGVDLGILARQDAAHSRTRNRPASSLSISRRRFVWGGLALGLVIATVFEIWRQIELAAHPGPAAEGVWLNAAVLSVALGIPVNVILAMAVDAVATAILGAGLPVDPFYLLLLGIVVNGGFLGWCVGFLADHVRSIRAKPLPATDGSPPRRRYHERLPCPGSRSFSVSFRKWIDRLHDLDLIIHAVIVIGIVLLVGYYGIRALFS